MSDINTICVAGSGIMGSQVAWQMATHGKNVMLFDAFEQGLEKGLALHESYAQEFINERGMSEAEVKAAKARITYTTDLAQALSDADLVVEQVPENLEIKKDFWQKDSKLAPEKTLFCTNTSSLLPSEMLTYIDRPEKFLTLHFCVKVWEANVGEVMKQSQTSDEAFNTLIEFAQEIGLVPIPIHKEQAGYVLNSLLIPLLTAALDLVQKGVADAQTIDRTWRICMANVGPMEMLDKVGMNVCLHGFKAAESAGNQRAGELAKFIQQEMIDKGKLGLASGKGFYDYPNPSFAAEDFLEAKK